MPAERQVVGYGLVFQMLHQSPHGSSSDGDDITRGNWICGSGRTEGCHNWLWIIIGYPPPPLSPYPTMCTEVFELWHINSTCCLYRGERVGAVTSSDRSMILNNVHSLVHRMSTKKQRHRKSERRQNLPTVGRGNGSCFPVSWPLDVDESVPARTCGVSSVCWSKVNVTCKTCRNTNTRPVDCPEGRRKHLATGLEISSKC